MDLIWFAWVLLQRQISMCFIALSISQMLITFRLVALVECMRATNDNKSICFRSSSFPGLRSPRWKISWLWLTYQSHDIFERVLNRGKNERRNDQESTHPLRLSIDSQVSLDLSDSAVNIRGARHAARSNQHLIGQWPEAKCVVDSYILVDAWNFSDYF